MDLMSKLLKDMVANKASDLFLSTGSAPALRINGKLHVYEGSALSAGRTEKNGQVDHATESGRGLRT